MENYEQEIYSFITQRQNFEPFLNLVGHYEMVKKELLENFWELIEEKVNDKFKSTPEMNAWEAKLEKPLRQYSQLYCFSNNWKLKADSPVLVSWENPSSRPYIGVWIDYKRSKEYDYDILKRNVQSFAKENNFKSDDNNYWALWRYGEIDFNKPHALLGILPDTREVLAEQVAEDLFGLALALEGEFTRFYGIRK